MHHLLKFALTIGFFLSDQQKEIPEVQVGSNEDHGNFGKGQHHVANMTVSRNLLGQSSRSRNCKFVGCEGVTRSGQAICDEYYAGIYSGRTQKPDYCDWDTNQAECCLPVVSSGCLWSDTCYGTAYGAGYVCRTYFGSGWNPTGEKTDQGCNGWYTYSYKCCHA